MNGQCRGHPACGRKIRGAWGAASSCCRWAKHGDCPLSRGAFAAAGSTGIASWSSRKRERGGRGGPGLSGEDRGQSGTGGGYGLFGAGRP